MKRYAFHPEALRDLDEIWDYIAEDSLDAGDRVVADILQTCESLAALPHQGHHRLELTSQPVRFTVVHDFLLAYTPEELPVWILAILHGKRNPRVLASVLRERRPGVS